MQRHININNNKIYLVLKNFPEPLLLVKGFVFYFKCCILISSKLPFD